MSRVSSRQGAAGSRWIGARPSGGTLALLLVEVAVFLLYMLLDAPLWAPAHLALHPARALGPEPWQLVTSGLFHDRAGGIFFSALTIWIFGTAVEQQVGRSRLYVIFAGSQILGALLWAVVGRIVAPSMELTGAEPGCLGLVAAFGVLYDRAPVSLFGVADMRSRTMALLFIGFSAVQYLVRLDAIGVAGGAAGAGAGWLLASRMGSFDGLAASWDRFRMWRLRRRYKVIPGGRDQRRYFN